VDELQSLRRENAEQRRQLAQLLEQNAQLVEQLARLNERVGELLAVAQRKQRKARAPVAAPPPAPPPVVEGEQQRAFDERPKRPRNLAQSAQPRRKQRLPGASRYPATSRPRSTSYGLSHAPHAAALPLMLPTS